MITRYVQVDVQQILEFDPIEELIISPEAAVCGISYPRWQYLVIDCLEFANDQWLRGDFDEYICGVRVVDAIVGDVGK